MNRVILIFRKDVVHLWPQILLFWAALVLFAYEDPTYVKHESFAVINMLGFLQMILPISCWLLVTSVVQEEKAIGDEQYWLTRPFTLADLQAAKILFLAVFICSPAFLCQAIVLAANGLSPAEHLGDLIAKQVFLAAWLLLPMAALAAVTRDLRHAFLGGLLALLILFVGAGVLMTLTPAGRGWGPLPWIPATLAALIAFCGSAAAVAVQYTRRRTIMARLILLATAVVTLAVPLLLPSRSIPAVQSWLSRPSGTFAVLISLDAGRVPEAPPNLPAVGKIFHIPIRVENLSQDLQATVDWSYLEFPLQSNWVVRSREEKSWVTLIDHDHIDKTNGAPIHLRGVLGLTLAESTVKTFWGCRTKGPWEPYPISPWFGPLESCSETVAGHRPVAHIQLPFDLGPLRLSDYIVTK